MDITNLGPPVPAVMDDAPPFQIQHWAVLDITNGLNEAIVTVTGRSVMRLGRIVLVLSANPRTGAVVRCTAMVDGGDMEPLAAVPGNVADLVRTLVRDVFGERRI